MFQIGRNTFDDRKNKILMKIPEFKRSGIGIIAEFHGILNGFPNQARRGTKVQKIDACGLALSDKTTQMTTTLFDLILLASCHLL